MKIKRIFFTGPPGSSWSSVERFIRWGLAPHTDNSDINKRRTWEGHVGAYHNPGNEPGYDWILKFNEHDRAEIERMMDSVYTLTDRDYVVRTHKSHMFLHHLDYLEQVFPDADIVVAQQEPYKSMLWWQMCGGHETVFDNYDFYEKDTDKIWNEVNSQTTAIANWVKKKNLEKEYVNLDFFRKHYGEPAPILHRMLEDQCRNPDDVDNLSGNSGLCKGFSKTAVVYMKKGTDI